VNVAAWKVRRLFEKRALPPAARVGPYRVFDHSDLPVIEQALHDAGYLKPKGGAA
jgi:hypothetical protein